ncbi:MAG TPA: M1 family aminopeptidase, partial [Blastocatellia bacterium]|nr:M1 family aminopeptidase [Blastocatellia bacterium]
KAVNGDVTVTLRPFKSGLREVELDAGEMTIKAVTLSGKPLQYKYENNEKLRIALDRAYNANETLSVNVAYSAVPKRGLVFITPNADDPTRPYQIWAGGEAENNHYWFPCYDYPNDFATTETNITVEDKYAAISNGKLMGIDRDQSKKTATYRWKMEQPFVSYLITVTIGEFVEVRHADSPVPISSWVPKNKVEEAKISFAKLPEMVRFFAEKTGVPYPYAKYSQVLVRDFPGALENVTATTMYDNAIHDKRALLDVSSDEIVAHELSHQWFGDLVTCRDWSELWLNESFATYSAHLFAEHDEGRDEMLYGILQDQRQYLNTWNSGNRRPVVTFQYDDPDSLFDVYAYPRGGTVLHMLRTYLGDEAWWKAINHYLTIYRHRNVETAQLKVAIEEATGQNLGWFFDQWVLKMGHPELEVNYSYDEAAKSLKLKVKQTQPASDTSGFPLVDTFRLPVDIGITTAKGERVER